MKYIYSFLILIGGIAGLIGLVVSWLFLVDKVKEWEFHFERKHKKYHAFKERVYKKILPVVVGILVLCVFLVGLVCGYFEILKVI